MSAPQAHERRAFALPMVILLMVAISLTISVAMRRHTAEQLLVSRQIQGYSDHHTGRGLQNAIGAWLRMQNGREIVDVLAATDGHAMDIVLQDESVVSVSLFDAQGTLLSNLESLNDRETSEAAAALSHLSSAVDSRTFRRETRAMGPFGVSARSASLEVLRAVGRACSESKGSRIAIEMARIQDSGESVSRQTLIEVATRVGLTAEERATMLRFLVTDVEMWGVVVEVRAGRGASQGRLLARYGGITRIRANTGRTSTSNLLDSGTFRTWKDLGIERQEIRPADLY